MTKQTGRKTVEVISLLQPYNLKIFFFVVISFLITGCGVATTRPKLEMSIAEEAYLAAKDVGSEEISPKEFRLAELSFLKAKSAYKKKFFDKAAQFAKISIKYSEMAELNSLRVRALGVENAPE